MRLEKAQRLSGGLVPRIERRDHGMRYQRRILHIRELHQPRPIREATRVVGRNADGQAGFADSARPDEADQA